MTNWMVVQAHLFRMKKVHLFIDQASYERGGMERSYASKAAVPAGQLGGITQQDINGDIQPSPPPT